MRTRSAAARAAGWFVVLNPAPARPVLPALLPLIDIVAPNETEAAALTGASDPMQAARHLVAQGARAALVTLGSEGALYLRCERRAALSRGDGAGGRHHRGRRCLYRRAGRRIRGGSQRRRWARLRRRRRRAGGDTPGRSAVARDAGGSGRVHPAKWDAGDAGDLAFAVMPTAMLDDRSRPHEAIHPRLWPLIPKAVIPGGGRSWAAPIRAIP